MQLRVGTALFALDKKGAWGHARVLKVLVALDSSSPEDGVCDLTGSYPVKAAATGDTSAVYVKYRGFADKHNEWIDVGHGRLRPTEVGIPEPRDQIFDVDRILDVRPRGIARGKRPAAPKRRQQRAG
eukprot:scaffold4971_cov94-Isochrysis_galbana.AAC.2